jgi:hypothetical protein
VTAGPNSFRPSPVVGEVRGADDPLKHAFIGELPSAVKDKLKSCEPQGKEGKLRAVHPSDVLCVQGDIRGLLRISLCASCRVEAIGVQASESKAFAGTHLSAIPTRTGSA